MNRYNISIIVLILAVVASVGYTQTISTVGPGFPLNTSSGPGMKNLVVASPETRTLAASTATSGFTLPPMTVQVIVSSTGAFYYGTASLSNPLAVTSTYPMVGTATANEGKVFNIYPGQTSFTPYFCSTASGAAPVIRVIAVTQR